MPQLTCPLRVTWSLLLESLLAFDRGVDVTGVPISPQQIGEGLNNMLSYFVRQSLWTKLQEGLSPEDTNRIVKLTGKIRSAANTLQGTA